MPGRLGVLSLRVAEPFSLPQVPINETWYYNLHRLNRLKWVMERSLTRTLALKLRTSISRVYRRYGATLQTDRGPCVGLQVTVERDGGRRPLVARWGGITLARDTKVVLNDRPLRICGPRT